MADISAVIITYNEEKNIARCIDSVLGIADEIVIVDSFSTDRTPEICLSYKVKFIQHPFEGYIEQKNYALSHASNDFVLSLDADEALSDTLKESIRQVKHASAFDGYFMNRLTSYCGKWIHHSGWYPDRKMRLFNRNKGKWAGVNPHDRFELDQNATFSYLKGDILHYSYYTLEEHRRQIEKFTDISSNALFNKGVRSGPLKIFFKPVARFLKAYFLRGGFLDGKEGFTIARMTARASYLKYSKLYKLQHAKS
jgi:glycosyltransferase involved in cell wall biosynthesis